MDQLSQQFQTLEFDNKQTQQIIHQSPNLNVLRKMFARPKNYMTIKHHEESLLFDTKNSISTLKAYSNRKKIKNEQSPIKKRNQFSKNSYFYSTVDSPEKANFMLESVKYDFEKSSKRKQYYEQILKMIEEAHHIQKKKPQKLQEKIDNFNLETIKTTHHNDSKEQYLLKSLNLQEKQMQRLRPKKIHSSTLSPKQKIRKQTDFFRIRSIKSSNEQFLNSQIQRIKIDEQNIALNPQKQLIDKNQETKEKQNRNQNVKPKKQINLLHNLSLPKIKAIKSTRKIQNENKNIRKGYISSHPEAKSYIKQNRQKLNDDPKMQPLMISGITATSFAVIDLQTMSPIAHRKFKNKIEIASISKVMTCYLCLLACKKYGIDSKKYLVRVSREASEINGTSADLQHGDCLTLQQSLYALMLPSGNDASIAIAQTIGKIIQRHKTKQTKKSYYETFLAHMNLLSRELKLQQEWKNSSGLPSYPNHSTPHAICLLTIAAMMDQKFRQIVSCKEFQATIKNQRTGLRKNMKWKNTNKLLNQGWQGIKTGTTDSAGHCLIAKKDQYLIAVFNSSTLSKRFTECSDLYSLVKSKQRYLFPEKWD